MTFIPEWPIILQFAIATFVLSITPGPDMTLFVGRALSGERRPGLPVCQAPIAGL